MVDEEEMAEEFVEIDDNLSPNQQENLLESEGILGWQPFYPPLYKQRYSLVSSLLARFNVRSVVDFGCAECRFIRFVRDIPSMRLVVGVDVDVNIVTANTHKLKPGLWDHVHKRHDDLQMQIFAGNVTEYDTRLAGIEAVTMIEVIEHFSEDVLAAFPSMVFGKLKPKYAIITTPNSEFNVLFPNFTGYRHTDHKFEWTREEFHYWCNKICREYGYQVEYDGIGEPPESHTDVGHCSQIAVFTWNSENGNNPRGPSEVIPVEDKMTNQPYQLIAETLFPVMKTNQSLNEQIVSEADYYIRWLAQEWAMCKEFHGETEDDPEHDEAGNLQEEHNQDDTATVNCTDECKQSTVDKVAVPCDRNKEESELNKWTRIFGSRNESGSFENGQIEEVVPEDEDDPTRRISIPLTKLMSFKQVFEICPNLNTLGLLLREAGYKLTTDGTSVLHIIKEVESGEPTDSEKESENEDDICHEEHSDDADGTQDDWDADIMDNDNPSGFICKQNQDFFTNCIGKMTLEDYNWSPDDHYKSAKQNCSNSWNHHRNAKKQTQTERKEVHFEAGQFSDAEEHS